MLVPSSPSLWAEGLPQVTSELPCSQDADCPSHPDCWFDWWPGCGCDEGRGRCDPNPRSCRANDDCFRREICSSQRRCVEPGPGRRDEPCNDDSQCPDWTLCLGGFCTNECIVDADCPIGRCSGISCVGCNRDSDCPGGSVCRGGDCQEVRCVVDAECGEREACRGGGCVAVACRDDRDCGACEVCSSGNACVSLCEADERCRLVLGGEAGSRLFLSACVDRDRECGSQLDCGGEACLGGRCVDLDRFLERLSGASK